MVETGHRDADWRTRNAPEELPEEARVAEYAGALYVGDTLRVLRTYSRELAGLAARLPALTAELERTGGEADLDRAACHLTQAADRALELAAALGGCGVDS